MKVYVSEILFPLWFCTLLTV